MTMKLTSRSNTKGFTILELLIVVLVIGILLGIILTTYTGIRQKERNTERQNDITVLQAKLELYYAENSKYPTFGDLNNATWRNINMKTLDPQTIRDPSNSQFVLASKPTAHEYAYIVTASNGAACDNIKITCAEYTLTATLEGGGTFTKSSLN